MEFTRARSSSGDPPAVSLDALTTKQRSIVETIDAFQRSTGEPCSANYLARRFSLHPTTVREHLSRLYRKGWLVSPTAPFSLRRPIK